MNRFKTWGLVKVLDKWKTCFLHLFGVYLRVDVWLRRNIRREGEGCVETRGRDGDLIDTLNPVQRSRETQWQKSGFFTLQHSLLTQSCVFYDSCPLPYIIRGVFTTENDYDPKTYVWISPIQSHSPSSSSIVTLQTVYLLCPVIWHVLKWKRF